MDRVRGSANEERQPKEIESSGMWELNDVNRERSDIELQRCHCWFMNQ